MKDIKIIGSGFSALAASCYFSSKKNKVTIYEKNQTIGGRARQLLRDGFTLILSVLVLTPDV
jgi:phytoene desaturase